MLVASITNLDQSLLDSMGNIITWKNDKGQYLKASTQAAKLLGWNSANDIVGHTDFDHPSYLCEFAQECQDFDKTLREQQTSSLMFTFQQFNKDDWRLLFGRGSAFRDQKTKSTGTVFTVNDVTGTSLFNAFCDTLDLSHSQLKPGNLTNTIYYIQQSTNKFNELSQRESECLFYILRGKTAKEVAIFLNISHRTVECHLDNIKNKLHCMTKSELIEKSKQLNFGNIIPKSLLNLSYRHAR